MGNYLSTYFSIWKGGSVYIKIILANTYPPF